MTKARILVTGATGKTGAVVVSELLGAGHPVRALVRRDDARAAALRSRGVEVAVGELGDPDAVARALRDVQRAYYVPPFEPHMLSGAAVFATAARDAGLESIVGLSQWLASPTHPALMTRQHWLADRLFAMVPGVAHTIVNPGFFADVPYLTMLGYAAHLGIFPWLYGDGNDAPPSVADIGRVAAAALLDPARHAGKSYRPTGPALLSGRDMVAILGKILGRPVRLAPIPVGIFLRAARLGGFPLALTSVMHHYVEDARRGAFALGAPNDDVRAVTGRAPESFETVAGRHAGRPENRRSFGRWLGALLGFLAIPFVPPQPIGRYTRALHATAPAEPRYVVDSAIWRHEHVR